MGHTLLRGYPDLDPSYITSIFSGDYVAGAHAAFAIMAALRHRRRTGEGQFIELAQAECAGGMLAQAFMDYLAQRRRARADRQPIARWSRAIRSLSSTVRGRRIGRWRSLDCDLRNGRRPVDGTQSGDG